MKVLMISGSLPPEPCGVGDYAKYLAESLQAEHVDIQLQRLDRLSFKQIRHLCQQHILHIQYPSRGYGMSLLPQLLSILCKPVVVTLHEFSQAHYLRKLADLPFLLFADKIIVTTDVEKQSLSRFCFQGDKKIQVIPVTVSFLPEEEVILPTLRKGISFFGLMRANKGLEEFIQLAQLIHEKELDLELHIFSAVPKGEEGYFELIQKKGQGLGIHWHINTSLSDVSRGLLRCKYIYMHYSDGVSERRSSFMAAIAHGLIVLSNSSNRTVERLKPAFIDVGSAPEALSEIISLELTHQEVREQQERAVDIFERFYSPRKVANAHIQLYKKCLIKKLP